MENSDKNLYGWIDAVNYAHDLCQQLIKEGYNVSFRYYIVNEHDLGIYLCLYDLYGNLIKEYASGIYCSFKQMKENLDYNAKSIRNDVQQQYILGVANALKCAEIDNKAI